MDSVTAIIIVWIVFKLIREAMIPTRPTVDVDSMLKDINSGMSGKELTRRIDRGCYDKIEKSECFDKMSSCFAFNLKL